MFKVNKQVFFVGETVIIEGKIEPPPENPNIQLVRTVCCRYCARWGDLWTRCDSTGYFRFSFEARIPDPKELTADPQCTGDRAKIKLMVRYQPKPGVPPRTFAEAEITVINAKPPVGEIKQVIAVYSGKEYNLYPTGEKLTVKYNDSFKLRVTLANTGGYKAKLYFKIIDAETNETVVSPAVTPVEVAPGEAYEAEVDLKMPEKTMWKLKIESGYAM